MPKDSWDCVRNAESIIPEGKKILQTLLEGVCREIYDLRIQQIKNQHFPTKISKFEVNYYVFD
jgi:hypothetical protein